MDYPDVPCHAYAEIRATIEDGDLLLCSGTAFFSRLIQHATGSVWSHIGMLYWTRDLDRLLVLESVESIGVRCVPLSHYLGDYKNQGVRYPGRIFLARHRACAHLSPADWRRFAQYAVDRLGYAYNAEEIARIAACILRPSLTRTLPAVADARSFICSQYVAACLDAVGVTIPGNPRGYIAPGDFAVDPAITLQWELA
jgi:hypothetical protein